VVVCISIAIYANLLCFLEFNAHITGRAVTLIDTPQGRKSSRNAAGEVMDHKCEDFSNLP
jgi:hypothetical protein